MEILRVIRNGTKVLLAPRLESSFPQARCEHTH